MPGQPRRRHPGHGRRKAVPLSCQPAADRYDRIGSTALAQDLLTDRPLDGLPVTSRVSSLVTGASSVAQAEQNAAAIDRLDFSSAELSRVAELARVADGVAGDLWRDVRSGGIWADSS